MSGKSTLDRCWEAYQTGRASADHTDKEVFGEVVGQLVDEIERLRMALRNILSLAEADSGAKYESYVRDIAYKALEHD